MRHIMEISVAYMVLVGRPEERRPLKDLSVDGRTLQTVFKKRNVG
jgi:hypothetical protein